MYEAARQEIMRLMHLSKIPIQNQLHPEELINSHDSWIDEIQNAKDGRKKTC